MKVFSAGETQEFNGRYSMSFIADSYLVLRNTVVGNVSFSQVFRELVGGEGGQDHGAYSDR